MTSATPVLTATVSAATTIYYALYTGNKIPIYSGTAWSMTTFTELSNATAQSSTGSAGPAVVANNSNYDLFVWSNSGTLTLTRGPLWSSDTVRGTGAGTTQISRVLGIWSNTVAITNGPGAGLGTYVGTVRSNGTATIDFIFGAVAASGTAAVLSVWNMYNRIDVMGLVGDTTDSWSYNTNTIRASNASNTMRVSAVVGLAEDFFNAEFYCPYKCNTANVSVLNGVGYDSTTAFSGTIDAFSNPDSIGNGFYTGHGAYSVQPLGFHFWQSLEKGPTAGANTFYGDNGGIWQNGLSYSGRF